MNKHLFSIIALILASCNTVEKQNIQTSANVDQTDTVIVIKNEPDTVTTDGISTATSVTQTLSFNGTLMIPPRSFATVALSMGGNRKGSNDSSRKTGPARSRFGRFGKPGFY